MSNEVAKSRQFKTISIKSLSNLEDKIKILENDLRLSKIENNKLSKQLYDLKRENRDLVLAIDEQIKIIQSMPKHPEHEVVKQSNKTIITLPSKVRT